MMHCDRAKSILFANKTRFLYVFNGKIELFTVFHENNLLCSMKMFTQFSLKIWNWKCKCVVDTARPLVCLAKFKVNDNKCIDSFIECMALKWLRSSWTSRYASPHSSDYLTLDLFFVFFFLPINANIFICFFCFLFRFTTTTKTLRTLIILYNFIMHGNFDEYIFDSKALAQMQLLQIWSLWYTTLWRFLAF